MTFASASSSSLLFLFFFPVFDFCGVLSLAEKNGGIMKCRLESITIVVTTERGERGGNLVPVTFFFGAMVSLACPCARTMEEWKDFLIIYSFDTAQSK